MNIFNIRRRLLEDGLPEHEVDERLSEMAEQRRDEQRDRECEQQLEKAK